jgi:hypothetical protein
MPNNSSGIGVGDGAQHNTIGGERLPNDNYECVDSCNLIRGNAGAGVAVIDSHTILPSFFVACR